MSTKLSTVIEVLSAIAVVISLVFVGLEIRNSSEQVEQNTQMMQIGAYQDLIGRIVEMNSIGIEDETTIESLVGMENPEPKDVAKLNGYLWILFRHGDMAYFQYEKGAINKDRLQSANAPLLGRLKYPTVVARWGQIEHAFVPSYRKYVAQQIKQLSEPTLR